MKKLYTIFLLLIILVFLTTYTPSGLNVFPNKENSFFKIKKIEILNNHRISEKEIYKKLAHIYKKNILFVNKNDLEEPLESVDFLKKIEVKKKYPDTVLVKVYETRPIAILFKKNARYLLDDSSNLINMNESISFDDLPSVFGEDAEQNFVDFFNQLEISNFPTQRVKNYYYYQIGRWDLQFFNNQTIKFPSEKIINAIQQSVELLKRKNFNDYNTIDRRIHDRRVVE